MVRRKGETVEDAFRRINERISKLRDGKIWTVFFFAESIHTAHKYTLSRTFEPSSFRDCMEQLNKMISLSDGYRCSLHIGGGDPHRTIYLRFSPSAKKGWNVSDYFSEYHKGDIRTMLRS